MTEQIIHADVHVKALYKLIQDNNRDGILNYYNNNHDEMWRNHEVLHIFSGYNTFSEIHSVEMRQNMYVYIHKMFLLYTDGYFKSKLDSVEFPDDRSKLNTESYFNTHVENLYKLIEDCNHDGVLNYIKKYRDSQWDSHIILSQLNYIDSIKVKDPVFADSMRNLVYRRFKRRRNAKIYSMITPNIQT